MSLIEEDNLVLLLVDSKPLGATLYFLGHMRRMWDISRVKVQVTIVKFLRVSSRCH